MDFISRRSGFQVQLRPFLALSPWADHLTFQSLRFLAYAMQVSARWCTDPEENSSSGFSVKQMLVTTPLPEPTNSNTRWWPFLSLLAALLFSVPLGHLRHRLLRHPSSLVAAASFPLVSVAFWTPKKDWPGARSFPSSHSALGRSLSSLRTRSIGTQRCALGCSARPHRPCPVRSWPRVPPLGGVCPERV